MSFNDTADDIGTGCPLATQVHPCGTVMRIEAVA